MRRLDLRLPVELDEQIAALRRAAGLDEADDDQVAPVPGPDPLRRGTINGMAAHRLDRSVQP